MAEVADTGEDQFLPPGMLAGVPSLANESPIVVYRHTHVRILHILGGLNPLHFISNLVDRVDKGADVPRNVVEKVNSWHDEETVQPAKPSTPKNVRKSERFQLRFLEED